MVSESDAQVPELQGGKAVLAVTLVILCLGLGSGAGWLYGGPMGGLLGVLVGAAVGALTFTLMRAQASSARFDEKPAPDVRELPPDQAMQVLAAMMEAGAGESRIGPVIEGGVLGEIGKARKRAKQGDLEGALAKLRALAEEHPRSPAVPAEIVRLLADHEDREEERLRAATQGISLAINGGMNRLAARIHNELEEPQRDRLPLESGTWKQLAKVLDVHEEPDAAESCRMRAEFLQD